MNKRVTCIIATYNSHNTISDTLGSVINQTYPDLEIIIADDSSVDDTVNIAHSMLDGCSYKIIVNPVNTGGPNEGKNKALSESSGEYIAFCDHDDIWEPTKIQLQVELMEKMGCLICTTGQRNVEWLNKKEYVKVGPKEIYEPNETFLKLLSRNYSTPIQNCMFSTTMIHKSLSVYRFESDYGMIDFDWILNIYHNRSSCEVRLPLMQRIIDGKNLSLNPEYRKKDQIYRDVVLKLYADKYPKETKEGRKRYFGSEGRYNYLIGRYSDARRCLLKSKLTWKNVAYYLSSFICPDYVKTHYHIFG